MSHLKKCFTTRHALYKIFKLQLNRQQLNCNQSKIETQRCHELIIKERSLRESIETEAQNHFKNFAEYKAKTTQEIIQLFARVRSEEDKAEQANEHDETIQQRNKSVMEVACVAGGMRERASGGGAAIFPASQPNKALAREIPPATQARPKQN